MDEIIIEEQTLILKQDQRGRVKITKERREALLDEFERSGMSASGFSRHYGLAYSTFANWAAKRRNSRKDSSKERTDVTLAEVVLEAEPTPVSTPNHDVLVVDLPGGASMQVDNRSKASLAATLINALGGNQRC